MGKRLDLHTELLAFAPRAYYQPPDSVRMEYPCFRYALSRVATKYANNRTYAHFKCYIVTYISLDPMPEYTLNDILTHFPYIRLDQTFTRDGLYHYQFVLFY